MKKILSAAICTVMILSSLVTSTYAAEGAQETVRRVAAQMNVIQGGETNYNAPVTRGEFARMLVQASVFKDTVTAAGNASPYKDVPYTQAQASYIKTAVSKGWMSGYLDGSFHPEKNVTAAEAAAGVLGLLGYTSGDFSGSFPEGQMAMYKSLGLGDGISAGAMEGLTKDNCAKLFYNLLFVKTKEDGKLYAEALGYKLDSNDKPDLNDMLKNPSEGPLVVPVTGWKSILSFTPVTVYRNDALASPQNIQPWDVLYYSKNQQTVWAYSRKVSGTLEKVSPSKEFPETVVVAGIEYKVTGDTAKSQLGTSGGLPIGSIVTLLLGQTGDVAAAYSPKEVSSDIIGLVTAAGTKKYTAANGASHETFTLTIAGVDGQTYTVPSNEKRSVGSLVQVSFTADGTKISNPRQSDSVSGLVSAAQNKIGQTTVAVGANILDVSGDAAVKIYLSRLEGYQLSSDKVLYCSKNAAGEITDLILKDVSGDQYQYGIVLSLKEEREAMNLSGSYRVLAGGEETSFQTTNQTLNAKVGPARIKMKDGQIEGLSALSEVKKVTEISGMTLKGDGETHTIWDKAAAYIQENKTYRQMDWNELDVSKYHIKAYYDSRDREGGRIRMFIVTPK